MKGMGCWGGWGVLRGFFLSKTDPQIILEARIGVKGTGRSLEIAFYPIAPPPPNGSATFNRHNLIALNGKTIREK